MSGPAPPRFRHRDLRAWRRVVGHRELQSSARTQKACAPVLPCSSACSRLQPRSLLRRRHMSRASCCRRTHLCVRPHRRSARATAISTGGRKCMTRPACFVNWSNGTTSCATLSSSKPSSIAPYPLQVPSRAGLSTCSSDAAQGNHRPSTRLRVAAPAAPDREAVAEAAQMIAKAERPLILTASAGRDPCSGSVHRSICDSPGPVPPALFVVAIIAFHEPPLRPELPRSRRRSHPGDGDRCSLDPRPFGSVRKRAKSSNAGSTRCLRTFPSEGLLAILASPARQPRSSRHRRAGRNSVPIGAVHLGHAQVMERHLLDRRLLRPRKMRRGDIVVPQEGLEPPLPCEN